MIRLVKMTLRCVSNFPLLVKMTHRFVSKSPFWASSMDFPYFLRIFDEFF